MCHSSLLDVDRSPKNTVMYSYWSDRASRFRGVVLQIIDVRMGFIVSEPGSSHVARYLVGAAELGRSAVRHTGGPGRRHLGVNSARHHPGGDNWRRRLQAAIGGHGWARVRGRNATNRVPRLADSAFAGSWVRPVSGTQRKAPHTARCAGPSVVWRQAQLDPTALSVLAMLLPAACTCCPWELACS